MSIVEVRRHAERAFGAPSGSALTPAGRAMAAEVAKESGPFALVVASPLPRAKETAELVGGRLDHVEPALLPDVGGASLFGDTGTLAAWARLLSRPEAAAFADEQVGAWTALARRVGAKERVLAISHGGIIDLPTARLAQVLSVPLEGPTFGHLEGVRVTFDRGVPTKLEVLRQRR